MEQSRKIVVNDIEIRESVVGAGDPVLLVHGWGANIELLLPLARQLLRHGYQLYMLDLPGFGESAKPPAPFSIFDYADFCREYLDYHGLSQVNYFGHSLGGRIGLILGSDHADLIKNMALCNSAGIRAPQPWHHRLRLRLYQSMRDKLKRLGADDSAEALRQRYNRRYASADFQAAAPIMRQTLIKVVNQDLQDSARRVAVPTILIWGDEDQETPLWMGEKLEQTIADAALIVHAGAGHYAYLDYPAKTAAIMHALFRSNQAKADR